MKTLSFPAAFSLFLFYSLFTSISDPKLMKAQCGEPPAVQPDTSGVRGGSWIPTWNPLTPTTPITVNCVVIFVDFPDDNTDPDNPVWPTNFNPTTHPWQTGIGWSSKHRPPHPSLTGDIIDPSIVNPGPTGKKWNITTYFRDMSYGRFNLIGHVVYQQARYPFYATPLDSTDITYVDRWNGSRDSVVRHVIEDIAKRVDSGQISNVFEGSDSWNELGARDFQPGQDNIIDLVILCFRNDRLNHSGWNWWTGVADFGQFPNNGFVWNVPDGTPDGAIVHNNHGVMMQNMKAYPGRQSIDGIWHEIGHKLGLDHQYWDGMWSVMTHGAEGFATMNSWERWKMGWMEFLEYNPLASMQGDGDTVTICDLATHPQAIRIRLPDSASSQYFYIEHHRQGTSDYITNLPDSTLPWYNPNDRMTYDIVDDSTLSPGMFIIYDNDRPYEQVPYSSAFDEGAFRVAAADGRWHWIPDGEVIAPWSGTQPLRLYRRGMAARSAGGPNPNTDVYWRWNTYKTDRQTLDKKTATSAHSYDYIWAWFANAGAPYEGSGTDTANPGRSRRAGDGGDAWTPTWNNLFSPWSNPNTGNRDGGSTDIAVQLLGQTDTSSTVKIWLSGSLNAPPSKPQHLLAHIDYNLHPVLTWEPNPEPDVDSGGAYMIQRCDGNCAQESNWQTQDTVPGNVALWVDTTAGIGVNNFSYRYRLCALDTQGLASVWSEPFHLYNIYWSKDGTPPLPWVKRVAREEKPEDAPRVALTIDPNPIGQIGNILWRIPEAGGVSIRIFDLSGRPAVWPVNGFMEAGAHSTRFVPEGLSAGSYFCLMEYRGRVWSTIFAVK